MGMWLFLDIAPNPLLVAPSRQGFAHGMSQVFVSVETYNGVWNFLSQY